MKKIYTVFWMVLSLLGLCACANIDKQDALDWIPQETLIVPSEKENSEEEVKRKEITVANNVLVIGNSITLGFGNHGMASSTTETDYYFLLWQYLKEKNPNIQMNRIAGFGWEGATETGERITFLEDEVAPYLDENVDLVLIQMGDNVNTKEKRETFAKDCEKLLEWVQQQAPNARILWIFGRYNLDNATDILKACEIYGAEFVDISIVSTDEKYMSSLESNYEKEDGTIGVITDYGVASHPGDYGMEVIYSIIVEHLNYDS